MVRFKGHLVGLRSWSVSRVALCMLTMRPLPCMMQGSNKKKRFYARKRLKLDQFLALMGDNCDHQTSMTIAQQKIALKASQTSLKRVRGAPTPRWRMPGMRKWCCAWPQPPEHAFDVTGRECGVCPGHTCFHPCSVFCS